MSKSAKSANVCSDVPPHVDKQSTTTLADLELLDPEQYVPLCIGNTFLSLVLPIFMDGYLAARKAFADLEQTEEGPYFFLTGYEYAHLARQHMPTHLSPVERHEWQRGFIVGWNVCSFYL